MVRKGLTFIRRRLDGVMQLRGLRQGELLYYLMKHMCNKVLDRLMTILFVWTWLGAFVAV